MKPLLLFIGLLTLSLTGCAQNGKKFTGIWEPVDHKIIHGRFLLIISEEGDHFVMSNTGDNVTHVNVKLEYSKKDDTLYGKMAGAYITLKYMDKEKHILFIPQTAADPVEFKKSPISG